jgi:enoyl-CoA hydratase/carnithine racemase
MSEGVVEVCLHRDPCNEIGSQTLLELESLVDMLRTTPEARALVWTSNRRAGFSAGADLRELYAEMQKRKRLPDVARAALDRIPRPPSGGLADRLARQGARKLAEPLIRREVRHFVERIHAVFDALDMMPITTVAAVHGICFGGGFELALTADLIIADRSARFAFPELRLGLVPGFGGLPRLERDVGNAVVRDVLFTGRSLRAKRAHALGLVSQVVARGEAPGVARQVAAQATRFNATTVARAKAFAKPLPRARLDEEIALFCELVTSPTVEDALRTFVQSTDVRPYLP